MEENKEQKPQKPRKKPVRRTMRVTRFGLGKVNNPSGAKPKMTPEVLAKIEQAFSLGCNDKEACFSAGISVECLRAFQRNNPLWMERKALLKEKMVLKAKAVIAHALNQLDVQTAKWYLEKQCREEFGNEVKIKGDINIKQAIVDWAKIIDTSAQEVESLPNQNTQEIESTNEPIAIEYQEVDNGTSQG